MGKFARLCSNPLHNTWFKGHARNVESTVVPTYKYLQAFRNIAKQNGLKSHRVRYVCRKCIEKAGMKRDFTKFLQTNSAEKISVNQRQSRPECVLPEIDSASEEQSEEENIPDDYDDSERTETLSCPSQKLLLSSQESNEPSSSATHINRRYYPELEGEVEINDSNNVILSQEMFQKLLEKAKNSCNLNQELTHLRSKCSKKFGKGGKPITDPNEFKLLCAEAGSLQLFYTIIDAMKSERQSKQRQLLNERRAVSIIYMMMYGQSQQANWFQVATARTVKGMGVSSRGVETLRNMGLTTHPVTISHVSKQMSKSHHESVKNFFDEAISNEYMVAVFIDDYHNIHTTHRPSTTVQTQPTHMATLLLKSFKNIPSIYSVGPEDQDPEPANIRLLTDLIKRNSSKLSKSYVEVMPEWLQAKFFDPESQRYRLLAHDYQQEEILQMRSMEECKLVDCVELPLKSYDDFHSALKIILENGLNLYLDQFVVPIVGDWPCQFYIRQVVYREEIHNLIPFIGPLHVSLNARENILLKFHPLFADLYAFLFDTKKPLAKKPRPWRISYLLEALYDGWLLIREAIMSVFVSSKDVQYLVLLNLLDNYIPLSLCIYSVVLKDNMADLYFESLLRSWVMFLMFQRRHYDKAPLIALSNVEYFRNIDHPLFSTLMSSVCAFDEYPVENFHSVLRARTRVTDTPEMISLAAKEIDARKHELREFQTAFVPEKKKNFSHKNVEILKIKAAEFLTKKFKTILEKPNAGKLVRGPSKKSSSRMTKWNLPDIFGTEKVVTNDVLPLGYLCHESSPNPNKKCDLKNCLHKDNPMWRIFHGCGHSFHTACLLPSIGSCPICEEVLKKYAAELSKKANEAVLNPDLHDDGDEREEGEEIPQLEDRDDVDNDDEFSGATEGVRNGLSSGDSLIRDILSWNRSSASIN